MNKIELVRKWGSSNADAVLDSECLAFSLAEIDGFIGYKLAQNNAIVFGEPIASPNDQKKLALAFQEYSNQHNYNVIYVAASETFAKWALQNISKAAAQFGMELFFDPHNNPIDFTGNHASLVRRKVRHAQKENTVVKEYLGQDNQLEEKMLHVGSEWLKSRTGPQIHISKVSIFENGIGKRWFYAQKDNAIVAVVTLNQLQSERGYLLNHLMITPDAPHGTPELLFTSVLAKLKDEGCSYVTVGAVPAKKLDVITGFSSIVSWMAKCVFKVITSMYGLQGRSKFWEKFHPQSKPSFILFSSHIIGLNTIKSVIKALNGKSIS